MMRELLLLRHGKSDWRQPVSDFDRPLRKRGRQGAKRIGEWLVEQALAPDYVLSSPAERTVSTAEKCVRALGRKAPWVHTDKRLYLADAEVLLAALQTVPGDCQRVLLVGHNPGLEDLVRQLASMPPQTPDDGKLMATATLAHFRVTGEWSEVSWGAAELVEIVRARMLAESVPEDD
ncbi:phosphohistidine phosphatase [Marinobacter zhejiangensis]|uniref:Phosphohistidine phosphatase n=2 Tax=Marinobacter zhejiangensis TaxID=488535 RepID=A0A1I4L6H6_9GAMM|nr:phosphohistidine phosphatase [Marinobacter zhejiangensis]